MLTYKSPLILQQNTADAVIITCKQKKPWISLSKALLEHTIIFHIFQSFLIEQVIHPFPLSLTFQKTDV